MFDILKLDPAAKRDRPQQIFDLLELSRHELAAREECIKAIRRFRRWKRLARPQVESIAALHAQMEGALFRRHAGELIVLYKKMRKRRTRIFKNYMNALPERGCSSIAA